LESNKILGVVLLVGLILLIKVVFFRPKLPESKTFRCARCSSVSAHSERTIEAWRRGITKLYCSKCHHLWLQSRPRSQYVSSQRSSSGCLSVVFLTVAVPSAVVGLLKLLA
jgi:hypothetical protein